MKFLKTFEQKLHENIKITSDEIIDILKSLEAGGKGNDKLINQLINKIDNNGKNILMLIAQKGDEELIDYILKFDIDINHENKNGENVLFYCKNLKTFKKFYELGVNIHSVNKKTKTNILINLASKKIFNVDIYKELINKGININDKTIYNQSVLSYSIFNKSMLHFLIDNNVNLNGIDQYTFLNILFYQYDYYINNRKNILDIFKMLFYNGMIIQNIKKFIDSLYQLNTKNCDIISEFFIPLKTYITGDMLIEYFYYYNDVKIAKRLLQIDDNIELYKKLKYYYDSSFEEKFADYIKKHPYMDEMLNGIDSYNL